MRPAGTISRILDKVESIAIGLSIVCILLMAVLMNVEVCVRYVFGFSTQISDEYSGYLFISATMLCLLPALRQGRFLQVKAVVQRLPFRVQAVLEGFAALCGACVCVVLGWQGLNLALTNLETGAVSLQMSETPLWIPQLIVPVGFVLLFVAYLDQGIRHVRQRWQGQSLAQSDEVSHGLD